LSSVSDSETRKAIKGFLLIVDEKKLFEAALGSYNLDFALVVAQVRHSPGSLYQQVD